MALAPAISIITAVATLAIIPFGNVKEGLGAKYGLYGIDVNIGILYAFAFGSLAFYGADARRLGVRLEVLVPRRDALGGAARSATRCRWRWR